MRQLLEVPINFLGYGSLPCQSHSAQELKLKLKGYEKGKVVPLLN
jgi:hypothetical protein